MFSQDQAVYLFGEFRLEPAEHRLWQNGQVVALTPKAFEILVVLVRANGRLLLKDELFQQVWPDTAVEEANLTNNIVLLRKVLGTDETGKSYIETVPRKGYRFVGRIESLNPAPQPEVMIERITVQHIVTEEFELPDTVTALAQSQPEVVAACREIPGQSAIAPGATGLDRSTSFPLLPPGVSPMVDQRRLVANVDLRRVSPWWWIGLVVGILGVGWGIWGRKSESIAALPIKLVSRTLPLTTLNGQESEPAFSPDGQQIAFVWTGPTQGNRDIYIISATGGEPRQFTDHPEDDCAPVWSPDGKFIAFVRGPGLETELIVRSVETGEERKYGSALHGLDWSPDGKSLAIVTAGGPHEMFRVYLINVETHEKQLLNGDVHSSFQERFPKFSPDGKTIALIRRPNRVAQRGSIFLTSLETGTVRQVTREDDVIDSLAWMPDGRELICSMNRGGFFGLWSIAVDTGTAAPVSPLAGQCYDVAVDPRHGKLAYQLKYTDSNIWRLTLVDAARNQWSQPTSFLSSTYLEDSPVFSPDGQKVAFTSNRTGYQELWMCNADGSTVVQLTSLQADMVGSPRWSPDSQRLAFDVAKDRQVDVYLLELPEKRLRQVTEGQFVNVMPAWSRDGRWLYFKSNRNGKSQLWKIPATGGDPVQLTQVNVGQSWEAPDGKSVLFTTYPNGTGIWQVATTGGQETPLPKLAQLKLNRYWTVTEKGIWLATSESESDWTIRFYDFATQQLTDIAAFRQPMVNGPPGLDISPDGKTLLLAKVDRRQSDLVVVEVR